MHLPSPSFSRGANQRISIFLMRSRLILSVCVTLNSLIECPLPYLLHHHTWPFWKLVWKWASLDNASPIWYNPYPTPPHTNLIKLVPSNEQWHLWSWCHPVWEGKAKMGMEKGGNGWKSLWSPALLGFPMHSPSLFIWWTWPPCQLDLHLDLSIKPVEISCSLPLVSPPILGI